MRPDPYAPALQALISDLLATTDATTYEYQVSRLAGLELAVSRLGRQRHQPEVRDPVVAHGR